MRKTIFIFLSLFCLIGSCANNETALNKPETKKEGEKQPAISQAEAERVAEIHLALKNWTWGRPKTVTENDGKYYLSYETPERERRLIGGRVLIVDKQTGIVSAQKRR